MKHFAAEDIREVEGTERRNHMAAYLLGELSGEDQLALEQEYFIREEVYQHLLAVEDELAYNYLLNRLSPERRKRFESTIGATERGKQNLEFARALINLMNASRVTSGHPSRYWLGIAAGVVLSVSTGWLAFRVSEQSIRIAELASTRQAMEQALKRQAVQSVAAPVEVSFLLIPGATRSAETTVRQEIPSAATAVRFELLAPPGSTPGDYAVTLSASGGAQVWSGSANLSGRSLAITVPAALLSGGTYQIGIRRLTAGEQLPELGRYTFHLARR